jgi:hypothetical protein
MNVSAENVEADETQQPKNQQNNKDSPKHKNLSFEVVTSGSFRRRQPRLPKFKRRDVDLLLARFFKHGA